MAKKKYDREVKDWITINGRHVPVFEDGSLGGFMTGKEQPTGQEGGLTDKEMRDKGYVIDAPIKDDPNYNKKRIEREIADENDAYDREHASKEALTNKLKELSDDELKERNSNILRAANDGIPNIKGQREAYEEEIKRRGIELDTSDSYKKNWTKEDALKEVESQLQFHYEHKELTEGDNPVMLSKDGRYSVARNWDEADIAMKKYGWKYEPIDSKVASEIGERARINAAKTLGIPYESKLKVGNKEVGVATEEKKKKRK